MTRIEITAAAYEALAASIPPERRLEELRSPTGGFYLWLERSILNLLAHARRPRESYSDVIIRLATPEAA